MHNQLLPEVVQAIKDLDSGKIKCYVDFYYLKVPKDSNSKYRECIVILRKGVSGWRIADKDNYQFNEPI